MYIVQYVTYDGVETNDDITSFCKTAIHR